MNSFKKSSFAVALMVAVGSAQAASVEVYGTVDTGLLYTHESRDSKDNNEKIHESADNQKIIMKKSTKVRTTGVWPVERIRPV